MLSQSEEEDEDAAVAGALATGGTTGRLPNPGSYAQAAATGAQRAAGTVTPERRAYQQYWQQRVQEQRIVNERQCALRNLQLQMEYIERQRQQRPELDWTGMEGSPGTDEAAEARAARMEAWLQARELTSDERANRRLRRGETTAEANTQAVKWWAGQPDLLAKDDCCGIASVSRGQQIRWRVWRVPTLKEGYCRRNTCECCAREEERFEQGGNWCSCLAVKDGLCRRCWIDWQLGCHYPDNTQYFGPGKG